MDKRSSSVCVYLYHTHVCCHCCHCCLVSGPWHHRCRPVTGWQGPVRSCRPYRRIHDAHWDFYMLAAFCRHPPDATVTPENNSIISVSTPYIIHVWDMFAKNIMDLNLTLCRFRFLSLLSCRKDYVLVFIRVALSDGFFLLSLSCRLLHSHFLSVVVGW